jgi:hypothetical protein
MPIQKCPLCAETKNVVSSHLMPARMYEYCRPPGGHHISVGSNLVIETDRHLQDYLLCTDCEDDLNKGGEMWLLPLLSRYQGPFPFYDILSKVPPDVVDGDVAAYAASRNPEIHVEKLVHFSLGVFWKAAVHPWSSLRTGPMIDLGGYAEPIQKCLRGEAGYPKKIALTIGVLPPPAQLISFHNPYQSARKEWSNFLFYVSGIEFALAVGPAIDETFRENCFVCNPWHPIIVTDFSKDIEGIIRQVWARAHKARNVAKYLKKP